MSNYKYTRMWVHFWVVVSRFFVRLLPSFLVEYFYYGLQERKSGKPAPDMKQVGQLIEAIVNDPNYEGILLRRKYE